MTALFGSGPYNRKAKSRITQHVGLMQKANGSITKTIVVRGGGGGVAVPSTVTQRSIELHSSLHPLALTPKMQFCLD